MIELKCKEGVIFFSVVLSQMATTPSLEDVKFIDQRTKDITFGYIRQVQSLFPEDHVYFTIPALVIHWCLLYYHIKEQFDPENCSDFFKLSNNNSVASQIQDHTEGVALLSKVVSSGIHRWRFKLNEYNDSFAYIGVFKAQHKPKWNQDIGSGTYYTGKCYAWSIFSANKGPGDSGDWDKFGEKIKIGDIIEMTLDLNKFELKYNIKGKDYGAAFKNIEQTSYRAIVGGEHGGVSYELLSYSN